MFEFITIFYNILEKYTHLLFKILSLISIKLLNKKEKEFYNNSSQSSTLQWTLDLNIADIPSKDLSRLWKNRRKLPSPLPSWLNLLGDIFLLPSPAVLFIPPIGPHLSSKSRREMTEPGCSTGKNKISLRQKSPSMVGKAGDTSLNRMEKFSCVNYIMCFIRSSLICKFK